MLEGDWAVHLHRDLLADVFGAPVGVRRLVNYLAALARIPTSGYACVLRGGDPWTHHDEQGALIAEATADIAQAVRQLVTFKLDKGKTYRARPPLAYPRPYERKGSGGEEVTRHDLRKQFGRRGRRPT